MNHDLTQGNIMINLLKFSFPIMVGNVLQQLYNVVDTLIVGRWAETRWRQWAPPTH